MKKILPLLLVVMMLMGAASAAVGPENAVFTKTESTKELNVGETMTFTIVIENPNPAGDHNDFSDVTITDAVPEGLEIVTVSEGFFSGNDLTVDVGLMKPGDKKEITVTAKAVKEGSYVNTAYATYNVEVLKQEAYDEEVLVKEAYDEEVLVKEAWTETIEHPAEYKWVVDVPGHWEKQKVEADHDGWTLVPGGSQIKKGNDHLLAKNYKNQIKHGYKSVSHATPQGEDWKWEPVTECKWVWIDTTYKQVLVKEAWTETIEHPAEYETVHHEAEYKTVHHDAVYELEQRDAVAVADPAIKINAAPVTPEDPTVEPKAEAKTVPMQTTGAPLALLLAGALAIFGGIVLRR